MILVITHNNQLDNLKYLGNNDIILGSSRVITRHFHVIWKYITSRVCVGCEPCRSARDATSQQAARTQKTGDRVCDPHRRSSAWQIAGEYSGGGAAPRQPTEGSRSGRYRHIPRSVEQRSRLVASCTCPYPADFARPASEWSATGVAGALERAGLAIG